MAEAPSFSLDLPDPDSDSISSMEFLALIEEAWAICDRFDLQTEIWRGRILRSVRDRERRGGDTRGGDFLQWLREQEISKTRAYALIQLAESADHMLGEGVLEETSVNNFSKRAFMETAQSDTEVQLMIGEAANEGQQITRKQVTSTHRRVHGSHQPAPAGRDSGTYGEQSASAKGRCPPGEGAGQTARRPAGGSPQGSA